MIAVLALLAAAQVPATPAPAPRAPAPAQLTPQVADARCVAAFGIMGAGRTEEVQRPLQFGALYFLGKLLGRDPGLDLRAAILAAATAVSPNPKSEVLRCGAELQKAGAAMQAVGASMAPPAPPVKPAPAPQTASPPKR